MASGRPWYKRNGADFVMATLSFPDSDHRWAYSAIIDMLNDRDRPLADDPGFICGFTGLSKRRWATVRAYLVGHGYLVETGDGRLSNPRFDREHAEREREREEAVEHGRAGGRKSAQLRAAGQSRLDLGDEPNSNLSPKKQPQESLENAAKTKDKSELAKLKWEKSAKSSQPPPQASRGRERASEAREESIQTNDQESSEESGTGRSIGPNPDLVHLLDQVSEASGYRPVQPGETVKAIDIVKAWRDDGIDFEQVVLPTIRSVVSASSDPTSSLRRFDKRVRHEAARHKAKPRRGNGAYVPPASPVLEPEGEDAAFRALRVDLLERHGAAYYATAFNPVRFEDAGLCQGDKHPLKVRGPEYMLEPLRHGRPGKALLEVALKHGFTEVW